MKLINEITPTFIYVDNTFWISIESEAKVPHNRSDLYISKLFIWIGIFIDKFFRFGFILLGVGWLAYTIIALNSYLLDIKIIHIDVYI